jgi:peptidoglycan/xylan/chitin deacetylase (PgdA/CDA1 family)
VSRPRLSVSLTVAFDAMSSFCARGEVEGTQMSRGEFDAVAVPRILEVYREHGVRTTFFIPGHTALAYPDLAREIAADGHEIGHHGWVHENPAAGDAGTERAILERGFAALDRAAGVRPRGYRSPAAEFGPDTVEILLEQGIVYDASWSASDFVPYYLRTGDCFTTTDPYVFGATTELVGIPFSWTLDDFPHFEFVAGFSTAQSTPAHVRELWQGEFDYAHAHCPGGVFDLTMHPQVIGRGHRLTMLEDLVEDMKQREGVVFEPLIDYATRWKAANPLEAWKRDNPLRVGEGSIDTL